MFSCPPPGQIRFSNLATSTAPPAIIYKYVSPGAAGLYGVSVMAKLIKASQWGKREFTKDSIPDNRTIKRWVENGLLTGKIVDGSVWVCESEKWGGDSMVNHTVRQLISEG